LQVARCLAVAVAVMVAAGTPAQAQPVALWHMDEPSGTVMGDSIGGHTGTLHGSGRGWRAPRETAYEFNGAGHVSVPPAADLNPRGSDVTITIRLRATLTPASPTGI